MKSKQACTISDEWTYKGMKVVFLENEYLKIGILADRGSDIFEFKYKPLGLDFLLRLPNKLRNPTVDFSQMRNTSNQFEDYYYGGWQEVLPNSQAFNYRGAMLGLHGEVSLIPWKFAIITNTDEEVAVKLWTRPLRIPLLIEKTLSLTRNEPNLIITEKLTNESSTHLDIMWGHHIAFGVGFLEDGISIETSAKEMQPEKSIESPRRFKAGKKYNWPAAENISGDFDDASLIPAFDAEPYRELCYLSNFGDEAYYTIRNTEKKIGFKLCWDGNLFKYLWLWQERFATKDFPWWGNCHTVALEPWTSCYTNSPEDEIGRGEWLHLETGQVISTELKAMVIELN